MEHMSESLESATQGATVDPVETAPQPATDTAPNTGQEQQADTAETQTEDAPEEPKRKPWFQQRIDELTREKHEARRQTEQLTAYLRQIQQGQQPEPQQSQAPAGYVPASEVGRIAAQQIEMARFNAACDDVADHGASVFKDFDSAVQNFQSIGGPPPALLEAVTALGKEDGARVFYDLGMNPDEAMRLARLSPARMAVEVAKMAARPAAPKPVSKVPPPITPISAARTETGGEPDAKSNPDAWRKWFRNGMRNR
jgi:hypothetical protein